jgi:hypothetical protein
LGTYSYHVWIGTVKYIHYTEHEGLNVRDVKQWFLFKRREFAHEQELRAMIILSPNELGQEVPCDLSVLMESVFIAPKAPPYMVELVSEICRRFGLDVEVKPSALDDPPPILTAASAV